jgi:predicted nucleotidyltransferase
MKIIGGTQADVYELGKAMKEFKTHLPFRLEALVTNDRVVLEDVASWIRELLKLRKQLQAEGEFKDEMPRM